MSLHLSVAIPWKIKHVSPTVAVPSRGWHKGGLPHPRQLKQEGRASSPRFGSNLPQISQSFDTPERWKRDGFPLRCCGYRVTRVARLSLLRQCQHALVSLSGGWEGHPHARSVIHADRALLGGRRRSHLSGGELNLEELHGRNSLHSSPACYAGSREHLLYHSSYTV